MDVKQEFHPILNLTEEEHDEIPIKKEENIRIVNHDNLPTINPMCKSENYNIIKDVVSKMDEDAFKNMNFHENFKKLRCDAENTGMLKDVDSVEPLVEKSSDEKLEDKSHCNIVSEIKLGLNELSSSEEANVQLYNTILNDFVIEECAHTQMKYEVDELDASSERVNNVISDRDSLQHHELSRLQTDNASLCGRKIITKSEFCCDYCGQSFLRKSDLGRHLRTHNSKFQGSCTFCGKIYFSKNTLSTHIKTCLQHERSNQKSSSRIPAKDSGIPKSGYPFSCEHCGKFFTMQGNLKRHLALHTRERHRPCDICGKLFPRKGSLIAHMRLHTNDRQFTCSICISSFTSRSGLTSHMRVHKVNYCEAVPGLVTQKHICEYCGEPFNEAKRLRDHIKTHTGERFYCKFCERSYSEKYDLQKHLNSHVSGRQFKCDICGRLFFRKQELTKHIRRHEKIRSFKCGMCGKSFRDKFSVSVHIKNAVCNYGGAS